MTSGDATTRPETGVPQPVRGRTSGSDRDVFDVLYGLACWILSCVLGTLVWPALLVLPKLSWRWKLTRAAAQLLCACLDIAFETSGVPLAGEPCVYVANHGSFLDSFAIGLMFPEPVVFVAGGVLARQRVAGSFLRRIGVVFVKSEGATGRSSGESVLSTLEDVVRSGRSIVLFPEGGLTVTPELRRFHLGAFVVAAETGRPVVPVGILGTRAILPAGRRLPRRGAMRLVVGQSLQPTGSGWKAAHELADKAREAVEGLLAEG
jgi:1-acyl-sn-glycerol-3-phosphate acyltransferase